MRDTLHLLVTVGTTPFDSLIRELDILIGQGRHGSNLRARFQVSAAATYFPVNGTWIRFSSEIRDEYQQADIVVCHAGAGTVFTLLEMQKRIVVVPNISRRDKHQLDIATWVDSNQYALVARSGTDVLHQVQSYLTGWAPARYQPVRFFRAAEIFNLVSCTSQRKGM